MLSFSQRKGLKPIKKLIQVDTMDDELRISLWNILTMSVWQNDVARSDNRIEILSKQLWIYYFKRTLDTYPNNWGRAIDSFREYYVKCTWNEAYDLIEFIVKNFPNSYRETNDGLIADLNSTLEEELSGYRFVKTTLIEITNSHELAEIESALNHIKPLEHVRAHLQRAVELLSDRKNPDYRNSIKESISAVESLGIAVTGVKGTLGQTLKPLEAKLAIHPALKEAFSKLYGYTSDAHGIRHALMEKSDLDFEDAKFMLISCSAFINYVIGKAAKASISLK